MVNSMKANEYNDILNVQNKLNNSISEYKKMIVELECELDNMEKIKLQLSKRLEETESIRS